MDDIRNPEGHVRASARFQEKEKDKKSPQINIEVMKSYYSSSNKSVNSS